MDPATIDEPDYSFFSSCIFHFYYAADGVSSCASQRNYLIYPPYAKCLPMKPLLLLGLFVLSAVFSQAQNVTALSPGKYEAKMKGAQNKWDKGDIILLDDSRYRLSSNNEVGEYRFSVAAQRLFFLSGPLKTAYTKVLLNNNKAVIVLPAEQNPDLGLTAEVWASKQ
jgi:hypothetical protein